MTALVGVMLSELRVEDPEGLYTAVRLCSDLPLPDREFQRHGAGWLLQLPALRLERLEYQLEVTDRDDHSEVICDPSNPLRAPGAFGEKSVVLAPDYRAPEWLEWDALDGGFERVAVRVLGRDLEVPVWSPGEGALPLLVAHDGPEYAELSCLHRYAGAMIESGSLPPFRVALLPPGERDDWYSASAVYGRSLSFRILPALREAFEVSGAPVGMGASLGALAMLQAQRAWPGTFGGLFLQSGSYFVTRFDRHESGFSRYGRIVRFVRGVLGARSPVESVPVSMTCGAEEENIHNNRLMAAGLADQGYEITLHEGCDTHNYTAWRDLLHPHLTLLLDDWWFSA